MEDKLLRLLGLALRGGNLAVGEAPVGEACATHKAKVVLVAADGAENSCRRAGRFAREGGVPLATLPHTKEELGDALGRNSCAMLAVLDGGLAEAMAKTLAQGDPQWEELSKILTGTSSKRCAKKPFVRKKTRQKHIQGDV